MGKHGYDNIQANERILEKIIKEIAESKSKGKATGKVTGKITKPHLYDFARVICGIGGGRMRVKMCENRAEIEVLIRGTLCGTKRSPVRLHKGSPVIIYDHKEIFAIIPETTPGDRIAIRALIADEIYPKCLLIPVDDDEDELDDSAGGFEFRHEEHDIDVDDKDVRKYMKTLTCAKTRADAGAGAEKEICAEDLTEEDIMAI
jgi:hypothetical protein